MQKVSKVKRFIAMTAMAAMLSITGLGAAQNSAQASIEDEAWSFSLAANSYGFHFIKSRPKENDSKIYFYWSSTYGGNLKALTVTPYGTDSHGNMVKAGTRDRGEATYSVNQTGKYRITNYVHELGLPQATVGVRSKTGSGTAKGVWSPDCAGTYETLQ